jgi:FKBP-type peptidyl-prolyl cis-trans isomerase
MKKAEKTASEKSPVKEQKAQQNGVQIVLALLLLASLIANIYFIIQINDLNSKKTTTPDQITGVTNSTIPVGSGKVVAAGMVVKLDYIGKFENGTVFDTSIETEARKAGLYSQARAYEPFTFAAGSGQVIDGFDRGVIGMRVGEQKTLTISPSEGYATGPLANKTLIFDVIIINASEPQKVDILIVNDKRCKNCDTTMLVEQLKGIFPGIAYTTLDYGTPEGKKLYTDLNLKVLPAVLFDASVANVDGYSNIEQFVHPVGSYLMLSIGSKYDPTCYKDDGSIDCNNSACAKDLSCLAKQDKPLVEVFVMSYCPYGTQIEKGILPVMKLLDGSADFSVKFCDYAMHDKKEIDENLLQYCIEKDFKDKYPAYLECFLAASKSAECVKQVGLDTAKLNACVNETDAKYQVTATFNDKSKWAGSTYPPFKVNEDDNKKYAVQGSPTFVLNGVVIPGQGRDPQSLLDAICNGFKEKPAACSQKLSTDAPSAGFGFTNSTGTTTSSVGCASA